MYESDAPHCAPTTIVGVTCAIVRATGKLRPYADPCSFKTDAQSGWVVDIVDISLSTRTAMVPSRTVRDYLTP